MRALSAQRSSSATIGAANSLARRVRNRSTLAPGSLRRISIGIDRSVTVSGSPPIPVSTFGQNTLNETTSIFGGTHRGTVQPRWLPAFKQARIPSVASDFLLKIASTSSSRIVGVSASIFRKKTASDGSTVVHGLGHQ